MRDLLIRTAFAAALAALAPIAAAQGVYKFVDPSGRTVYTDDPNAGSGTAQRVELLSQPAGTLAAGLSEAEKKMLEQANRRLAALDRAIEDIIAGHRAFRAAEARREQGVEPLEGERAGRLLRAQYWARQQALEREVEAARTRLDEALARRNALR